MLDEVCVWCGVVCVCVCGVVWCVCVCVCVFKQERVFAAMVHVAESLDDSVQVSSTCIVYRRGYSATCINE